MRHQAVIVSDIHVGRRWRSTVNSEVVDGLVSSIKEQGLRYPVSVVFRDVIDDDGDTVTAPALVAGRHRLEAIKRLGWKTVDCDVFDDEIKAEKWEISENLHRADLTDLERGKQEARWIELTDLQKEQTAPFESSRADGKGHNPEGGIAAAARELGIDQTSARRSMAIAAIPDAVAEQVVEMDLANSKMALVQIGKAAQKATKEAARTGASPEQVIVAAKSAAEAELEKVLDKKTAPQSDRKARQRDAFWKMVAKLDDDVRRELFDDIRNGRLPS